MNIPFTSNDFAIQEELVDDRIILIGMDWPVLQTPLLIKKSYILIDTVNQAVSYFICEKSLDGKFMISCIVPVEDQLARLDYGEAPDNLILEKEKVIDSFISYFNPQNEI